MFPPRVADVLIRVALLASAVSLASCGDDSGAARNGPEVGMRPIYDRFLTHPDRSPQALQSFARDLTDAQRLELAQWLSSILSSASGETPEDVLGQAMEGLRVLGARASTTVPVLRSYLTPSARVFQDRVPEETSRLRSFAMVTLAQIGAGSDAEPLILEQLSTSDRPYDIASAALAARLSNPRMVTAVPYLTRLIEAAGHDDLFSLDRFSPIFPDHEATTAQQEAIRALGSLGASAIPALPALKERLRMELERKPLAGPIHLDIELERAIASIQGGGTNS
jgi:hypothetical protein